MAPAASKMGIIAFVVGAALTGAYVFWKKQASPPPPIAPKTACDQAIEGLDATIAFHQRRWNLARKWIEQEGIALSFLARAQLTGDVEDYAAADRAVTAAFEVARPGSGPFLARARVSFALHRFDRVEPDLAKTESAIIVSLDDQQTIAEMRADLLFHRGRYEDAKAAYEAVVAKKRTIGGLVRLAQYRSKTADFAGAEALVEEAIATLSKRDSETRAWLLAIRAGFDFDRGRFAEARAYLERASSELEGWPLVEEQLAKVTAEMGDHARAEKMFEALAARTRNPEHLHGWAATFEARGEFDRAQQLHEDAKRLYETRVALLPEAFSAHALSHVLTHGDVARAVEIAEANHISRPTAESKVLLAQAYMVVGRVDDARRSMTEALSTPISTAELHATAAYVFSAAGDVERAKEQQALADRINPTTFAKLAWLSRNLANK